MHFLMLSLRLLRRDWASGEVRVLALAILIAVTSISAIGFFTDRIGQALELQANELLGGDLVVVDSAPLPGDFAEHAKGLDINVAQATQFPSMVGAGEQFQLASVKAVTDLYPLRGSLRIADELFAPDYAAQGVPSPGQVWAEARLLSALGIKVGDVISVGSIELTVNAVITADPARAGGNVFNLAPSLLLNKADLASTQLITPASRVRYYMFFAGEGETIRHFRQSLENMLSRGQRIQGIEDARPEVRSAVDKAGRFLGLAAMISVILACVAVAMSTRRFVSRHLDNCAIMRCVGASQKNILRLYTYQMLWLGLLASCVGLVFGLVGQALLVEMLGTLAKVSLPPPTAVPGVISVLVGTVTLLSFAYPTLQHLRDVPTLRVLRRDLGGLPARSLNTYVLGAIVLCLLVLWQARDAALGMYMVLGIVATFIVLGLVAFVLVKLLGRLSTRLSIKWRFAVNNISRRSYASVIQIVAFGLGLMVLLILTIIRGDLLQEWGGQLPENTPNRFLINIQPDQVDELRQFLTQEMGAEPQLYPMLRARLVALNGENISAENYQEERAKRLVSREFNLSWTDELPPENIVVKGEWWTPTSGSAFSVEEGLAKTLNIKMNDRLTFEVAGQQFDAPVTNLRQVDWENFRVNFFVVAPAGYLEAYPSTYITSFYLPKEQYQILNRMLERFPNVTVIDVAAVLDQVRRIIQRVTQAIEYVFIFTVLAGLVVLYAAIHSTLDERMREAAILRTLGATKKQVWHGLIVEFAFLGAVAGLVAALTANVVGAVIADKAFHLAYGFAPSLWLMGLLIGAIVIGIAGVLGTRGVLKQPPLTTLREI